MAGTIELAEGVHWVGVRDWHNRLFDALIPMSVGTTYNSYLVIGSEATALVDTVSIGFEDELVEKISAHIDPREIDYVVMNHAEPDHATGQSKMLELSENATLITSKKGVEMAERMHLIDRERIKPVESGETISLGDKTLRFVDAPWLHWPETMFTFLEEESILFTCDFFGTHYAPPSLIAEELDEEELLHLAKKYYGGIMMPFKKNVQRGIETARNLSPRIIAPSHGPIYTVPSTIIDAYDKWVNGELSNKVVLVYVSMWGSTEKLARALGSKLVDRGVEVVSFRADVADISELMAELVDAKAIAVGAPTVLGKPHPSVMYATYLATELRPRLKHAVVFGSHGWSGGGVKGIVKMLEGARLEMMGMVEVHGTPRQEDINKLDELADKLADVPTS